MIMRRTVALALWVLSKPASHNDVSDVNGGVPRILGEGGARGFCPVTLDFA